MFKITCACLLAAAAAYGDFGVVVKSYAAPAGYPIALAHGGSSGDLWVYCNSSPYNIYRLDAETGSVYGSVMSPWGYYTKGLAYGDGKYLYVGDYSGDYVYRVRYPNLGNVISSFPTTHDMHGGLSLRNTGDGGTGATQMWASYVPPIADIMGGPATGRDAPVEIPYIYLHNLFTGSIISSFLPMGVAPYDVAWDWRNNVLWGAGGPLIGHTTTGSMIGSFWYMRGYSKRHLVGICYEGEYLWAGCTRPVAEILKIHCPGDMNVSPASMGKIKAMYR